MSTRSDYIGINNPAVFAYANAAGIVPDYFADAVIPDEASISELNPVAFANPYEKTYPCHNKVACVMSAIWNAANGDQEGLEDTIKGHARALGIENDVDKIYSHFSETMDKAAAEAEVVPEPKYALELESQGANGPSTHGYYPITNQYEVEKSARTLASDYQRGTISDSIMRKLAMTIAAAAEDMSNFPIAVQRFATPNLPDPYAATAMFSYRNKHAGVNNAEYMQILNGLKNSMEKAASIQEAIDAGERAVEALYALDARNQLHPSWEDSPTAMLMCGPTPHEFRKAASSRVYICKVPVPVAAIAGLGDTLLEQQFSKTAAEHLKLARARVLDSPTPEDTTYAGEQIGELPLEVQHRLLQILSAE